jgi:hypothetical protein
MGLLCTVGGALVIKYSPDSTKQFQSNLDRTIDGTCLMGK